MQTILARILFCNLLFIIVSHRLDSHFLAKVRFLQTNKKIYFAIFLYLMANHKGGNRNSLYDPKV